MKTRYKVWTLIQWDGNPALNLQCWRKSFRRGHVSVGVGEFKTVVFSYGANSENSFSSTRARVNGPDLSETEAKALVDSTKGHYL